MPQRKRRRFAPMLDGLEPRLPLDGECECGCDMPPADVEIIQLPPIEEIFAGEPGAAPGWQDDEVLVDYTFPPEDAQDGTPTAFLDSLPDLDPLGPAPPDLEDGRPPFVPLPPAPIGPSGPA